MPGLLPLFRRAVDSPLPIKNDDADCAERVGFQSTGEPVITP
jgi:hypothetical protein